MIQDLLGIKYPIFQGGMAKVATGTFAATVSNSGGLGIIGAGGMNVNELEEEIALCHKLTTKPFGVNLMLMHPQAAEMADLIAQSNIAVVTTGAGNPRQFLSMWKEKNMRIFPVVSSVVLAKKMESLGVDGVIAEGTESGGHVGEMTTMTLTPQVVDALHIPVIAAGGIAGGRQMMAAFALGAQGVQIGTCLLTTKECPIHENYKMALIKAKDNDTTVTGRIAGTPVRVIKNQMARDYIKREKSGFSKEELEQYTLGSLYKAVVQGDAVNGSLMAGQVAGQLHEILSVQEVLDQMMKSQEETFLHLQEQRGK